MACESRCPGVRAIAATDGKGNGAVYLVNTTDKVLYPKVECSGWRRGATRITDGTRFDALSARTTLTPYAVALVRMRGGEAGKTAKSETGVLE